MKIMLGQVKPSKAQTRTIGSIEALLLLSEWHPRALHFPTAADGWDCELMIGTCRVSLWSYRSIHTLLHAPKPRDK